ncbi:MAG: relaxase/mobilization nuclease domain-containing protein [Alphaproteobacteria bacterium]|nr:relaxase/mobilization nuclease domain-containing protein [Alphaproteobacteria bacterium]
MIIKASQRSGAIALANHLMNLRDNDHVTLYELRGFIADNLHGAMKEAEAIRKGCKRLKQHVFSVSLNPPEKAKVTVQDFEDALERLEKKLGLAEQPRATVFHEKEGRRHLHAVYSRVDMQNMRAINMAHFKRKLQDVSRELYRHHGWKMPKGLMNNKDRAPLNYSLAECQQAKRTKTDPKVIKSLIQDCWNRSDNVKSFRQALEQNGLVLAKGDRRGHVAVDWEGNVYAVSRWAGIRTKAVREMLGQPDNLPTVDEAKSILARKVDPDLQQKIDEQSEALEKAEGEFLTRLNGMRQQQREDRSALENAHEIQRIDTIRHHADALPTGLKALWFRLTGQYRKIKGQIEQAAMQQLRAHAQERETLIRRQLLERRALQQERWLLRRQIDLQFTKRRAAYPRSDRHQCQRPSAKKGRSRFH